MEQTKLKIHLLKSLKLENGQRTQNRHSSKEDVQIANKNMRCSTSLLIRKKQIKKQTNTKIAKVGKDVEKLEPCAL